MIRRDARSMLSQALHAMGHTVNCICCMRGVSRISLTHHLYGRRMRVRVSRPNPKYDPNLPVDRYRNQKFIVYYKNHADPTARAGTPWHERPAADRLWALEQILPSMVRCQCGVKRVKRRKSPLMPLDLVRAIQIYIKMPMGLTLSEFLAKTFGDVDPVLNA